MLSNDVAALGPGESCEALLLTPKARVIAPLVVLRRGHEDFLLLTEPELGERVRAELLRSRFAAKAEIEPEEHTSHVVFGGRRAGSRPTTTASLRRRCSTRSLPSPSRRRSSSCCASVPAQPRGAARSTTASSRRRPASPSARSASPRAATRARSRSHGCTTAGTPTVGSASSRSAEVPEPETEVVYEGKSVGRITSAAAGPEGVVALAYVRREVPADAELAVGRQTATPLH